MAKAATLLQFVDVIHCLLRITKGNVGASLVQVHESRKKLSVISFSQIIGRYAMLTILEYGGSTRDSFTSALLVAVYALVEPCRLA